MANITPEEVFVRPIVGPVVARGIDEEELGSVLPEDHLSEVDVLFLGGDLVAEYDIRTGPTFERRRDLSAAGGQRDHDERQEAQIGFLSSKRSTGVGECPAPKSERRAEALSH